MLQFLISVASMLQEMPRFTETKKAQENLGLVLAKRQQRLLAVDLDLAAKRRQLHCGISLVQSAQERLFWH